MSLSQTYWSLSQIVEQLLDHCQRHNIVLWPEFGTLIGVLRHCGVVPWDYDGDFALFSESKQKLIDTWNSENYVDFELDMNYYNDAGSGVAKLKGNEQDIVDLVFYAEKGDIFESLQTPENLIRYPAVDAYRYAKDEILPLTTTTFLGRRVYLPARPLPILQRHYGAWQEYPEEFAAEWRLSRFALPHVRPLPRKVVTSVEELIELIEQKPETPFILHQTELLSCTEDQFQRLVDQQKELIYGYSSSTTWEWNDLRAEEVYESWKNKQLSLNIVDSPLDAKEEVLPAKWQTYIQNKVGDKYSLALCWVFTNAPKVTHFHTDPKIAGGFMRLLRGEKIWWMVAPKDFEYLESRGHTVESLAKKNLVEMLQLENSYLFGKIFVDTIRGGDFLWFPIDTLHKVFTTEDSLGFGGYL